MERQFLGQRHVQELETQTYLSTEVAPDDSGFSVHIVVDSVVPAAEAELSGIDLRQLYQLVRGLRVAVRLGLGGETASLSAADTASVIARQVAASLQGFFPRLPRDGVTPGSVWADTTHGAIVMSELDLSVTTYATHQAVDWTQFDGLRALEIVSEARSVLSGRGTQGGQDLALEGEGARQGRAWVSAAGDYLGGSARDSTSISVQVLSTGAIVPVVQTATTETRRLH